MPSIKFGAATERNSLTGQAAVSIYRYAGGSDETSSSILDHEDYQFRTRGYHRTELDEIAALFGYTRDSTIDSELEASGQVIRARATREQLILGPTWARSLSEKTSINTGYQYIKVDYSDEIGPSNLVSYDYHTFSTSLTHVLTPLLQGTISGSYNLYKPETKLESKTLNLQAGLTRQFSETLSTSWQAGIRQTRSDATNLTGYCFGADIDATFPSCNGGIPVVTGTTSDENTNNGSVYSASVTKLLETGYLRASLSRSSNPSSNGELLDTTRLLLAAEHRITETIRTLLRIDYFNKKVILNRIGDESDQQDTSLLRIRPKIFWRWDRKWEVAAEYEYAKDEDENSQDATRNAAYLTLSYRPDKFSISR